MLSKEICLIILAFVQRGENAEVKSARILFRVKVPGRETFLRCTLGDNCKDLSAISDNSIVRLLSTPQEDLG